MATNSRWLHLLIVTMFNIYTITTLKPLFTRLNQQQGASADLLI